MLINLLKNISENRKVETILIISLGLFSCTFAEGIKTYYNLYENFNYESPAALSAHTGNQLFDFVPVDMDELDIKSKFIISFSTYVRQAGDDYGNDVKSSENVDLLKNFCFLYNYQREFMPFISYSTPYKSVLNRDEEREIVKKRDAVSLGVISDLRQHQVGLSVDALMSTYSDTQIDNGGDYVFRRGGFSARMTVNMKTNKRSSMLISVVSPVFLDFDIDDNNNGSDRSYFDRFQASTAFSYKYKKFFAVYSIVYKDNKILYDDDSGLQLTYPWLIEHNLTAGYVPDKNIRVSLDYQLLPSVFTSNMPEIGDLFRHTIGAFASVNLGAVTLNARYSDSRLLSDDNIGRVSFQADLVYSYK
ncbi:MAG: hypothetical protein RBS89_04205 [Candidatus Delongbacteria bacterium]|jgi:hypothetical protein|nr:hypothetical protein [Candidatus Delongbacteria bacterium]